MASSGMNVDQYCQTTVNFKNYVTVMPNIRYTHQRRSRLYNIWKEQMVCLLDSQGLLDVVDGETLRPLMADDDKKFRRRDRVVKGWILGSIGEDALGTVVGLKTARDVWLELEKIFTRDDDDYDSSESVRLGPQDRHLTEPSVICGGAAADSHSSSSDDEENDMSKTTHKSAIRLRRRRKQKWVAPEGANWLYKAALRGDWEAAERLFEEDMERSKAEISCRLETPLHAAVGAGKANNYFVKKLLELLPDEAVALQDCYNETALHYAARVGNLEAAVMLVDRKPDLLYMTNNSERLPVQIAAIHCHKEILTYFIRMSKSDVKNNPFVGNLGVRLLMAAIASEFFGDVALELVEKYPELSRSSSDGESALSTIAGMSSAFPDEESFSWCHNFIFSCN